MQSHVYLFVFSFQPKSYLIIDKVFNFPVFSINIVPVPRQTNPLTLSVEVNAVLDLQRASKRQWNTWF